MLHMGKRAIQSAFSGDPLVTMSIVQGPVRLPIGAKIGMARTEREFTRPGG